MTEANKMCVEVAYALPHKQEIVMVEVLPGTTAMDAVLHSGIDKKFPGLQLEGAKLGCFGKAIKSSQVLRGGDRVEIYRPLLADPKDARKERAAKAKARKVAEKVAEKVAGKEAAKRP